MNKKGFTLVEMLIVISFIAIIALVAFPNLSGMLKKIDNQKYQRFLSDVFIATEAYVQANIDNYSELKEVNGKAYIYFDELIESNYLKSTTYDPKNKKMVKVEDFTVEVLLNEDKQYKYKLYEERVIPNYCEFENGYTWEFDYTGGEQEFEVPCDGTYKIEAWGAQGGSARYSTQYIGGYGGYTSGNITLHNEILYFYVGGQGVSHNGTTYDSIIYNGDGYNGGNSGVFFSNNSNGGGGGGATDVRIVNGEWNDFNSLKSRIIVAGAGGGGDSHLSAPSWSGNGGHGGGLNGYDSIKASSDCYRYGTGGTQRSVGKAVACPGYSDGDTTANFGIGGNNLHAGGGSGYYGGSAGNHTSGAGGSSFISGHDGCDAIKEESTSSNIIHTGQPNHYSGYIFTDTIMIDGEGYNWTNVKGIYVGQPQPDGSVTTGHSGNGYARITYLGV